MLGEKNNLVNFYIVYLTYLSKMNNIAKFLATAKFFIVQLKNFRRNRVRNFV